VSPDDEEELDDEEDLDARRCCLLAVWDWE